MMETTSRKTYLDAIRILACFCVIYNHVMGRAVIEDGPASFCALFAYFFSKTAVPLFFMITGALLLPRIDTYKKSFQRFLRIAIALVLFYTLSYAAYCLRGGVPFSAGTLARTIYRDRLGVAYSYWYLYRYLSILVMLPILQRMTARLTQRDIRYFLLIAVGVCGMLYSAQLFAPDARPSEYLTIPLFSVYIGMLLLGLYIDRYAVRKRSYMLLAGAGLLLCVSAAAFLTMRAQVADMDTARQLDRCERTSVVLAAGCAFYLLKCFDAGAALSVRVRNGISRVGRLTFTAYLVSEMLIDALYAIRAWLQTRLPVFGADMLYVCVVFAAGMAIATVATRIPLLKKLL